MKGKVGLAIGLSVGYVLGTRAGRERYEQMKTQWLKLWNQEPVQRQVVKVQTFATSAALAVPGVLWEGAKRVTRAVSNAQQGAGTQQGAAGEKVRDVVRDTAEKVGDVLEDAAEEAQHAADDVSRAAKTDGK